MKKIILILTAVLLVGCSQDEQERNANNQSFTIPDLLIGYHQKQYTDLFMDIEKHKVTFNTPEGEIIVITQATQMATDVNYTALAFNNNQKIIDIELVGGGGVRVMYLSWDGTEVYFTNYYARVD